MGLAHKSSAPVNPTHGGISDMKTVVEGGTTWEAESLGKCPWGG